MWIDVIFPQIAIAIGFLLPIGGGGRRTTLADWTWHQVPLQGAVDVVPLLGAILGCHCSVLWLGGGVSTNFGGAIAGCQGCHCSVPWWGEGDGQLWGSGRGAIAGCPWHPTQQWHPEKTSRKSALSFLQSLHCSLH